MTEQVLIQLADLGVTGLLLAVLWFQNNSNVRAQEAAQRQNEKMMEQQLILIKGLLSLLSGRAMPPDVAMALDFPPSNEDERSFR